ncbi:MAG: hypothetical protein IPM92_13975 [Saprospiraceae bacterium]|nr:hypothetical protein [Saprospiraceae bacterium]
MSLKVNCPYSLVLIFTLSFCLVSYGQNAKEVFGKNKVQFSDDQYDWWQHETNNFIIYYYGKSRPAARFCSEIAESENAQIQKLFEFHLKDKIELFVYADATDHSQSNINLDGIWLEKNWQESPKLKDQKILLYFDGNHANLRQLLRAGIIKLYFASLFDGTALQDAVQKVISLKLPEWFESGLIAFLTSGWNKQTEQLFLEVWKGKNFDKFSKREAKIAGLSFWSFLVNTYGQQSVSNWLYLTRIQKDFEEAARIVFSEDFENLQRLWYQYYYELKRTSSLVGSTDENYTKLKLKPDEKILKVIPDNFKSNSVIISTQQFGKSRIRQLDLSNYKLNTLFCKGSKSKLYQPDLNYPIYCDRIIDQSRIVLYEKRNRVYLKFISGSNKNQVHKLPEDIQRVYSAAVYDKDYIALSANVGGYSDILLYSLKSRQYINLTNDHWDDLDVNVLGEKSNLRILFRSNKPLQKLEKVDSSTAHLPLYPFGLFELTLNEKKSIQSQKNIYSHKRFSVLKWIDLKNEIVAEINDQSEQHWIHITKDTSTECLLEKHPELIIHHPEKQKLLSIYPGSKNYLLNEYQLTTVSYFSKTELDSTEPPSFKTEEISNDQTIATDSLYFQAPFGNPSNLKEILNEFKQKELKSSTFLKNSTALSHNFGWPLAQAFNSNQSIAYRNRFYIEELSTTLNNDLLFSGLNTFSGTSQDFEPPEIGILFKTRILEILENYSLEAGIRIPTSFNGLESYLLLENRLARFDHTYAVYFKTQTETTSNTRFASIKQQTNTFILNHQLKFPLDHYTSLRAISTLRNDHVAYLSTNSGTLLDSSENTQQRIGTRLEWVFDNALDLSLNLKSGWQVKFYFEASKRFQLNFQDRTKFLPGALFLIGFEGRLHIPVFKKSSFSQRVFTNISLGQQRILYHVGATENWLVPKYETQNPLITSGEYVYSALATEVRGHGYGARKAASVFGYTAELRIPIFQYLLNQNYKNSLLRNFQMICFYDAAVVWDGFFPDIDKTSTVDYAAQNPVVKINLQYSREPWIAGSGFGFRTSLFGYYLRIDHAWQVNRYKFSQPKWLFSLGLDF